MPRLLLFLAIFAVVATLVLATDREHVSLARAFLRGVLRQLF